MKHTTSAILLAALVALAPCSVRAATTSELLEKGIYTEETKGDLDGAIAIYQQLTAEAKAGQALAAQAQLRLGQCLLKKQRSAEAAAAFEKLIREYPNEKELVAKAREYLPAEITLGPVTWADGERLHYALILPAGMEIGAMESRAVLATADGKSVWRVGRRMTGGGETVSSVDVEPETFRPLASYWKHTLLGEASAVFQPGEIEIRKAGAADPTKLQTDKLVFDNEACFHLFRRLPLKVGYKTTVPIIATLGGGAVIPLGIEVGKRETVKVPAGEFECFKLQLSIGQTMWYSDDATRCLVKFEAGGATGVLTAIEQRKGGAPVAFRDEALGISFTAPPEWLVHRYDADKPGKQVLIRTYDALADSDDGGLRLFATDSLPVAARASSRAFAEHHIGNRKDVKVRPESWQNHNISGRLGVSCVGDYLDGEKPRVQFMVHVIGPKWSEFFVISSAPEKFDALKTAFDSMVASYRTTK